MLSWIRARLAGFLHYHVTVGQVLLLVGCLAAVVLAWVYWRSPRYLASPTGDNSLGVQQLVQKLKGELQDLELQRRSQQQGALFHVKDFDLELSFVVKSTDKLGGKLEYEIVTAELARELGNEKTHKITLHMEMSPPSAFQIAPSSEPLSEEGAEELPFVPKSTGRKP